MATVTKNKEWKNERPLIKIDGYGKVPPNDLKLEQTVLGACLNEEEQLDTVMGIIVKADVFYSDINKKVYQSIQSLYNNRVPVDMVTLTEACRSAGTLETIGGAYYIATLFKNISSTAHTRAHAYLLIEKYLRREAIRNCAEGQQLAWDETRDVFEVLEHVNGNMYDLATLSVKKKPELVNGTVRNVLKAIYDQKDSKRIMTGVNTGFPDLNEITGGWQKTDLIIIAARPGVGKTGNVINMAMNAAVDKNYGGPVGIFTLEVPREQIIKRMLSAVSGVLFERVNNPGKLEESDISRLNAAGEVIASMPILIDDTSGLSIGLFITKARELVRKHGVKLLMIDYLQLMRGDNEERDNREQQISKITRKLKETAKELDVPIIALSQMSRSYGKEAREPILEDLRESGGIEQDADFVMFLYRPMDKQLQEKPGMRGYVLGSIKKHRNGRSDCYTMFLCNNKLQRWICASATHIDKSTGKIAVQNLQSYHIKPISGDDVLTAEDFKPVFTPQPAAEKKNNTGYQAYTPGADVPAQIDDLPF